MKDTVSEFGLFFFADFAVRSASLSLDQMNHWSDSTREFVMSVEKGPKPKPSIHKTDFRQLYRKGISEGAKGEGS